jgi:hypothetical protein
LIRPGDKLNGKKKFKKLQWEVEKRFRDKPNTVKVGN